MISVRYIVCSERQGKPVTRAVCGTRAEADLALERLRQRDQRSLEPAYWIAELGSECDAWRSLVPDATVQTE